MQYESQTLPPEWQAKVTELDLRIEATKRAAAQSLERDKLLRAIVAAGPEGLSARELQPFTQLLGKRYKKLLAELIASGEIEYRLDRSGKARPRQVHRAIVRQ